MYFIGMINTECSYTKYFVIDFSLSGMYTNDENNYES